MLGFFYVIAFNIWNIPKITWIFPKWITRILSCFRSFEILLRRVFLWNPYRVEIKKYNLLFFW